MGAVDHQKTTILWCWFVINSELKQYCVTGQEIKNEKSNKETYEWGNEACKVVISFFVEIFLIVIGQKLTAWYIITEY